MGLVRAVTGLSISVIVLASAGAPAIAAELYVVPPSIDPSGTRDVTADLIAFVAGIPDGSTIAFQPGGRYRIEGTFLTEARHNLVFEGNDAAFFATTEGVRNRSHWRFNHSTGITVRDVVVTGANEDAGVDGPYMYEREAQHGFAIEGSSDVTLERVRVTDVWGDLVYIDKHAGVNSRRVSVRDSFLEGSGRQGIGVAAGEDIIIERNWIAGIRRSTIDLEPHNPNQGIRRVLIRDNDIGPGRFYFVAAGGMAVPMEDITILHNRMHGKVPSVTVRGHPEQRRQRIIIAGNVADTHSNRPVFTFGFVDGVLVINNTVRLEEPKQAVAAVETTETCYVTVAGNDFGEAQPFAAMSASTCPGRNAIGLHPSWGGTAPAPSSASPGPAPASTPPPAPTVPPPPTSVPSERPAPTPPPKLDASGAAASQSVSRGALAISAIRPAGGADATRELLILVAGILVLGMCVATRTRLRRMLSYERVPDLDV